MFQLFHSRLSIAYGGDCRKKLLQRRQGLSPYTALSEREGSVEVIFFPTQQKGAVLFLPSAFPLALTSVKLAVKTCTPLRTPEHHELSPRPSLTRIQFGKNNIEGQQSAGGHCPMYIVALSALHDLSGGKGVRVHGLTVQSFVHCALEDMLVST